MSLQSWKAEFYPVPAHQVHVQNAIEHSLRKWEGFLKKNMKKHGLCWARHSFPPRSLLRDVKTEEHESSVLYSHSSCALCRHFSFVYDADAVDCYRCPLEIAGQGCLDDDSPYHQAVGCTRGAIHDIDARPMVRALRKLLDSQKSAEYLQTLAASATPVASDKPIPYRSEDYL